MKQTLINYKNKTKSFVLKNKIWSLIIIVLMVFIGYKAFSSKTSTEIKYVTALAQKGTIVSSISGSGQVEALGSVDIKSKASGDISYINVKSGQKVKKGQVLFAIENRDAEINLEIAKNNLADAEKNYANTKSTEETALKTQLLELNSDVAAVPDDSNSDTNVLTISGSYNSQDQGRYTLSTYACQGGVCVNYSGLENGTFDIDVNVPKALGTRGLYVVFTKVPNTNSNQKWYIDIPSPTTNSYLSNLRSYTEKQESAKVAIDSALSNLTSAQINLKQKENALADYYATAPFDGTIGNFNATVGQSSSGTSLGTIITDKKIGSITLNEVDIAKIKLGQKVTVTFDAIDGFSIAGEVVSIDSVGTVSSGVVNYNVKISFDTDDDRIKPGMTLSANIVTDVAQDVLYVPNSAVKSSNDISYVEVFDTPLDQSSSTSGATSKTLPKQQEVKTGLSNDTIIEIKEGLKEGDIVVSRTISSQVSSSPTSSSQAPSLFGNTRQSGLGNNNALRRATGR